MTLWVQKTSSVKHPNFASVHPVQVSSLLVVICRNISKIHVNTKRSSIHSANFNLCFIENVNFFILEQGSGDGWVVSSSASKDGWRRFESWAGWKSVCTAAAVQRFFEIVISGCATDGGAALFQNCDFWLCNRWRCCAALFQSNLKVLWTF